jgi:hypothetical protein
MLDKENETRKNKTGTTEIIPMFRFALDSLALVSVAGFVWMVCRVAQIAG